MSGFGVLRVRWGAGLVMAALGLLSGQVGWSEMRIPEVHGSSFADTAVNLPEDLKGRPGVLVVGFSQGSRDAVTAWGKRLAVDYLKSDSVVYYEMPVLAAVPRMLRGFVMGRIKASVSEPARPHFVPLLDDEAAWRRVAQYKEADAAYVLVIDGQGLVRWQMQGLPTEETYGAVKRQVEMLRAGH